MKITHILGMLMTMLLVWGDGVTSLGAIQLRPRDDLKILRARTQEMVLELVVDQVQTDTVTVDGHTYRRLRIPGLGYTARPGEPQVPVRGTLLGLPSTMGVAVQILEAPYETWQGYHFAPAPTPRMPGEALDEAAAGDMLPRMTRQRPRAAAEPFYPGSLVTVGSTGYLRDQAVAQVQFFPVQYHPGTGEVRVYRRIRARVTWDRPLPGAATGASQASSPVYEPLLRQMLLNYKALNRPAAGGHASPRSVTEVASGESGDATPALKIGLTEDGLYVLTADDLIGAGFDLTGVDPRTITLSNRGVEVPISVYGEEDGVFDPMDYILFYGTGMNDIYTATNVYWLTAGGALGRRMGLRDGTLTEITPVPTQFPATLHAEQDTVYWQRMPNGTGQDHWFWGDKLTAPSFA